MNLKQFDHNIKGNGNKGCFGQSKAQKKYRTSIESIIAKLYQKQKKSWKEIGELRMICRKFITKKNKYLIEG